VANSGEGTSLDFSGTYGIRCEYAGSFSLFSMSLKKSASAVTTNQWRYETDFKATDTVAAYKAEGLTLPSGATFKNGYVSTGSNVTTTFAPGGNVLSGDYVFAPQISGTNENAMYIRFNYIDSSNYYELFIYHKAGAIDVSDEIAAADGYPAEDGYVLRKKAGGTLTVLDKKDLDGTAFEAASEKCLYTFKVKNTTEGKSINVIVTAGNASVELSATDTAPFENGGSVSIKQNYTGTSTKLYSLTAYSLVDASQSDVVTYAETIVDEEFSASTDSTSFKNLGFTASSSAFDDTYGVYWSKSGNRNFYYTNEAAINGTYSFETDIYRNNNNATIYFTRTDDENCYALDIQYNSTNKYIKLMKYSGGNAYTLKTIATPKYQNEAGRGVWSNVKISLTPDNNSGDLTIDISYISGSYAAKTATYVDTATDVGEDGVDNGAPITSGKSVRVYQGYAAASVKDFKLIKLVSESGVVGEEPVFIGRFYCDDNAVKEIASGDIYFEYPTSMLKTHKVVAALYENHEMTAIKTFDPVDLYAGKVKLFDTTNADLDNTSVKVYFFDAEDTLNKLTEVYELN